MSAKSDALLASELSSTEEQLALFPKASLVGRDDAKVLLTPEESKALLEAAAAARL